MTTQILSRAFARRSVSVPIERDDDTLTLAVADPYNIEVIENIERMGYKVNRVVAPKTDILKIITEFYGFRSSVTAAAKEMSSEVDLGNLEQFVKMKSVSEIEATDKHIVNAVEFLFRYAFDQRASDIHIEPKREASEVRLRIDGMLHTIHKIPKAVHPAFVSRIKMLSRMDIAEKRRPQDGRIKTEYKSREVELRVSTMPTAFGEKVVIRIFDPDILLQDLEEIGFAPREYELFRSFIARPHGIILVTGPTGSGKTTTLYSALKTVATPEVNVVTIEDPIEMVHDQFNQVSSPAADRRHLRQHAQDDPAPGPGHHHGGRDPRPRNGGERGPGGADRPPGLLDAAHERCAELDHAAPGPGRAVVPYLLDHHRRHGAAAGPKDLQTLRKDLRTAARRGTGRGTRRRTRTGRSR